MSEEGAQICTSGLAYWTILKRVNSALIKGPLLRRVASNEMGQLLPATKVPSVRNRINQFIANNRRQLPSNDGGGSGPKRA